MTSLGFASFFNSFLSLQVSKNETKSVPAAICTNPRDYDFDAPTKQNLLCSGLSAFEVVRAQIDTHPRPFAAPNFRLSLKPAQSRRYVFVLDVSQRMSGSAGWSGVRNALYRFMDAWVAVGDEVAVVTFGRQANIRIRPTSENRNIR